MVACYLNERHSYNIMFSCKVIHSYNENIQVGALFTKFP